MSAHPSETFDSRIPCSGAVAERDDTSNKMWVNNAAGSADPAIAAAMPLMSRAWVCATGGAKEGAGAAVVGAVARSGGAEGAVTVTGFSCLSFACRTRFRTLQIIHTRLCRTGTTLSHQVVTCKLLGCFFFCFCTIAGDLRRFPTTAPGSNPAPARRVAPHHNVRVRCSVPYRQAGGMIVSNTCSIPCAGRLGGDTLGCRPASATSLSDLGALITQ